MNWPAPTALAPPPRSTPESDRDDAGGPTSIPETGRHRASAVPAAVWVALLGGSLVLLAAVAIVASNWNAIGESFRVAGLALATGGLLLTAERLRSIVPSTAGIIAHVGTFLTASVGIAILSLLGYTWPLCVTVGGLVLAAATGLQAERWRRPTMHLGQIVGLALAATGVAALAGATAGLVAVLVSVALLVGGAERRAAVLAMLAVASPALSALADAGVGDGTLARAGLVGERLGWSGPIVGLLAATVIGSIALRRRNNPLTLIAAASPVIGVVTGLAAVDGSVVAWWSVPALVLVAAELGLWMLPGDRSRELIATIVTVIAAVVAAVSWLAPALIRIAAWDTDLTGRWAVPVVLTAVALATSTLRWRSTDDRLGDLGLAAIGALTIALPLALSAPALGAATASVVVVAVVAFLSRRLDPLPIHGTACWSLVSIAAVGHDSTTITLPTLALLGGLLGVVLLARTRLAAGHGIAGWIEMTAITTAGSLGALAVASWPGAAVGLTAATIIAAAAAIIDRRLVIWSVVTTAVAGLIALDAATASGSLEQSYVIGWVAATAVFATVWMVHHSRIACYAAAAAATLALATAAPLAAVSGRDFIVMAMILTVATTGLAFTAGRRTALDAAAVTTGGLLLMATTFDIHVGWVSAAWFVLGLQIAVAGLALDQRDIQKGGLLTASVAAVSWWFTSGLDDWFLGMIEPAGITVADLWFAVISLAALGAGVTIRSATGANSWVAYSATLAIPALWLSGVHLDRPTVWAIPLLLTIGVVAAGLGAWRRLAAPLVGGTVLTIIATLFATGSDLTALPVWIWLALAGAALLSVAVLIERTGQPGRPNLRQLVSEWR